MASNSNNNDTTKTKQSSSKNNSSNTKNAAAAPTARILVLHGNRQTGQLLLGRMDKLRKKLLSSQVGVELVAIDAPFPHPQDSNMKTWWNRRENSYEGLQESMELIEQTWNGSSSSSSSRSAIPFVGLLGFSQGARLVHLLTVRHEWSLQRTSASECCFLPGLQFAIQVAGYDAALPENFPWTTAPETSDSSVGLQSVLLLNLPTLHVWGEADRLILPAQSQAVMQHYRNAARHVHDSGHHVPMRADSVRRYVEFVQRHTNAADSGRSEKVEEGEEEEFQEPETQQQQQQHQSAATPETNEPQEQSMKSLEPDDDTTLLQREEVEALRAIYPDEFHLLSNTRISDDDNDGETILYEHPITYTLDLPASDEGAWPPHPIQLLVTYPHDYPQAGIPTLQLQHDNDGLQFNSSQSAACLEAVRNAARAEEGSPCVLSCMYAAREFFESGGVAMTTTTTTTTINNNCSNNKDALAAAAAAAATTTANVSHNNVSEDDNDAAASSSTTSLLKAASPERIKECNKQGLEIAERLLYGTKNGQQLVEETASTASEPSLGGSNNKKGGLWLFTIGLVGKPSAGKSTLFNTATGFARQKQQAAEQSSGKKSKDLRDMDHQLGGATMAPHPFTTIDPNIGFCLVPAPPGSCPEDDKIHNNVVFGSTHGRDSRGRRLLPVLLKDVAGLVPGAYQGRGRGNQFLNDLTDADVLIHVLDASGRADPEGNVVIGDDDDIDGNNDSNQHSALHPLNDMAWIQNELIEWVYTNLALKWETVRRRGRDKLLGMFSGYGQPQGMTWNLLHAVERYLEEEEHRDRALDRLDEWDSGDLHRLVSAFLGVRFPIALALNKMDLPGSRKHIDDILSALPVHGTHVGSPLSARSEMMFSRREIEAVLLGGITPVVKKDEEAQIPLGTWQCLQSAIGLREPVLVFPVVDHTAYAPLPGMFKYATSDPSLPSPGMIACLNAAGGSAPTEWDPVAEQYSVPKAGSSKKQSIASSSLRDALIMKPGSTVEDVFLALKKLGALGGEFVRAEAAGEVGAPAKPIPKHQVVTKENRILKIMTNKRTAWQSNYS